MSTIDLFRKKLEGTKYVLNQYDEIVCKIDYVTVGAIENNLIVFVQGRSKKLQQLYLNALFEEAKRERYSQRLPVKTE